MLWTWINLSCLIIINFLFCEVSCSNLLSLKFNILYVVNSHTNYHFISGINVYLGVYYFQYESLVLFIIKIDSAIHSFTKLSCYLDELSHHIIRYFRKITLILIRRNKHLRRGVLSVILLGWSSEIICKFEMLTSFYNNY